MAELRTFRDERSWLRFHRIKDLSAAIAIEAAELQEITLWLSEVEADERTQIDSEFRARVEEELADVLIFALQIALRFNMDPAELIRAKMRHNATKYPAGGAAG
jgi:NTP pyrophosphatase (non-canonical NTP hydrolase)